MNKDNIKLKNHKEFLLLFKICFLFFFKFLFFEIYFFLMIKCLFYFYYIKGTYVNILLEMIKLYYKKLI